MFARITIHKIIISINARKGFLKPKNSNDQKRFNNRLIEKIPIANHFLFPKSKDQTK